MAIERKYERDVDILLAEEFSVNSIFSERIKNLTKFSSISAEIVDVWVSKSNSMGESDLIVLYQAVDGRRFALLIEDKVDAPLQPQQAERYRIRAEQAKMRGEYDEYEVILCAPEYYISSRADLDGFDRLISFESVAEILTQMNDGRSNYRAEFLLNAGTRRVNKWSRENDVLTNEFWDAAYNLAIREFPILEMKRLTMTKGSTWIQLRPRDLPTKPKHVYISLKGDRGYVDLTFSNTQAYLFQPKIANLLHNNMSVHQTSASTAVRINVEGFQISDGIENGMIKVRVAFESAARLIEMYRQYRAEYDRAARDAAIL